MKLTSFLGTLATFLILFNSVSVPLVLAELTDFEIEAAEAGLEYTPTLTPSNLSACSVGGYDGTYREYPETESIADLSQAIKDKIKATVDRDIVRNITVYKEIGARWGIPWQALAATHWREAASNPGWSMVNGRVHPTAEELLAGDYAWASAHVHTEGFTATPEQVPLDPLDRHLPRRHYGTIEQDIDYATYLLIEHINRHMAIGEQAIIDGFQTDLMTTEDWERSWGKYLGSYEKGYGRFGVDSGGRLGAGAIFAYMGGMDESPPPAHFEWPGTDKLYTADSDYNKVAFGTVTNTNCAGGIPSLGELKCPANVLSRQQGETTYYQLPNAPNDEYVVYSGSPDYRWGQIELVCLLFSVGLAYNDFYNGDSKLYIGDLNRAPPAHASHKWGIAVDLYATGEISAGNVCVSVSGSQADRYCPNASALGEYSSQATINLGKMLVDSGLIKTILFCSEGMTHLQTGGGDGSHEAIRAYAENKGTPLNIKCWQRHHNHFHVNINIPKGEEYFP